MSKFSIFTINNKKEESFLRQQTDDFDFSKHSKKEIREILKNMRIAMKMADGIGLSANQVGINAKVFVAQVENKFYAIFNPEVTKKSKEEDEMEEGCLSVPEYFGKVKRAEKIWIKGYDAGGKKIKIKAWGFLARIIQHELDHLEGKLFIDKTKEIYKLVEKKV